MFKQLHVWSSKEAIGNEEKKNGAEPEMGYCPFEHWLGAGRAGAGALGAGRTGVGALGVGRTGSGRMGLQGAPGAAGARRGARAEARGTRHDTGRATRRRGVGNGVGAARARRARCKGMRHGRWARAWTCCWAAGCALGVLSLFLTRFDSVLFLSQFLDIVHELGS